MVLVGLTIFMFTFLETIVRVNALDKEILDSARALNVNTTTMVKDILIPYVLPGAVSGLRINLIMAFMILIFSEMIGATHGLGVWINVNHSFANYTNIIAGFIEIGVIVVLLNKFVEFIQRKTIKWH